jgi:hypothetical protein
MRTVLLLLAASSLWAQTGVYPPSGGAATNGVPATGTGIVKSTSGTASLALYSQRSPGRLRLRPFSTAGSAVSEV